MQLLRHRTRTMRTTIEMALLSVLLLFPLTALSALEKLDDAAMADVSGAGMAIALDDFRWMVKPTSYFEQVGSEPTGGTVFQRGDLRWYGVNISGAGSAGFHWDENGTNGFGSSCNASSLACPRGGTITDFSPHDNPYVLRAFSPEGLAYNGDPLNQDQNNPDNTIYEYLAPTSQPDYTLSFWGEIEAGRTGDNSDLNVGTGDILKNQTIIRGNAANSIFRLFQFTEPGNETFALMYHSYLQGDFRFSVAQHSSAASDEVGVPVQFDGNEGLHFRNVDAFIPLGQLYYQALTLDSVPANDGNFILEIPRLRDPSVPHTNALNAAMEHFYSYAVAEGVDAGYVTARTALLSNTPGSNLAAYEAQVGATNLPDSYNTTHGYSRWGDWFPCNGIGCPVVPTNVPASRNSYNDTNDGIIFKKCTNCSDFNAFAYRLTAVDVRRGSNTYNCPGGNRCDSDGYTPEQGQGNLADRYYVGNASCNSGSEWCGYGGSYAVNASGAYTNVNQTDPSTYLGVGSQRSGSLPVIRTGVANLGDARAEGLLVNYMKFTSLGAGN